MADVSLSVRVSAGNVEHNNRDFFAPNVDTDRSTKNILYKKENLREVYDKLFKKAQVEHDEKQTRAREKFGDYYTHIKNSKQEKLFYEAIVQFGDKDDMGVLTENGALAKNMLDEFMKDFEERNPRLYVFNATLHLDEATPHLHIDFVPFAANQTRGLSTKVSLKQALAQQGLKSKNQTCTERQQWAANEKKILTAIAKRHGLGIKKPRGVRRQYLKVNEYKIVKDEIKELQSKLEKAKGKPSGDLTQREIDFIRNELSAKQKKLNELETENARLKTKTLQKFSIPDDAKLIYITERLGKEGIEFVEEIGGFTVSGIAAERVREIEKAYKPVPLTWRERAKLDIDKLIYDVGDLDGLLQKLREKGYTVKRGKYIAIKPNGAERFIRTRSLGTNYTTELLEKRIKNNHRYEKELSENIAKSNGMTKEFYTAVSKVVVLFYKQSKVQKRYNPNSPWTMTNDFHINELVNCIKFINSRGINSGTDLQMKIESLNDRAEQCRAKIDELIKMNGDIKCIESNAKFYRDSLSKPKSGNQMDEMRIAVAKETLDYFGIKTRADLDVALRRLTKNDAEIAELKSEIEACDGELAEYTKLRELYEQVQTGSYVDRLVKLENERLMRERDGTENNYRK